MLGRLFIQCKIMLEEPLADFIGRRVLEFGAFERSSPDFVREHLGALLRFVLQIVEHDYNNRFWLGRLNGPGSGVRGGVNRLYQPVRNLTTAGKSFSGMSW